MTLLGESFHRPERTFTSRFSFRAVEFVPEDYHAQLVTDLSSQRRLERNGLIEPCYAVLAADRPEFGAGSVHIWQARHGRTT